MTEDKKDELLKIEESSINTAELRERETIIAEHSKSESTKRGYQTDWKKFTEFCKSVNEISLPATSDTIRMYLVYLDKIGRKPSTLRRAMTAIRQAHVLSNNQSPITSVVHETMKGILRIRGVSRTKKSALTIEKLDRVLRHIPCDFIGLRDRAIILVGWTAGLRRQEIVDIDFEDIENDPNGLVIKIKRSKTDQFGEGRIVGLPFIDGFERFCAARALNKWIQMARIKTGPVFRKIGKRGSGSLITVRVGDRLGDKQVSRIIKRYVELAGFSPHLFGGHSLRSGLVTTLATSGTQERVIMNITGHKSAGMLREYIQRGELFSSHPIVELFKKLKSE